MTITTLGITRTDGPGGRHYQVEGYDEPFPSVTTVLNVIAKPALVPWARNVALEKVRDTLYEHLASGDQVIDPLWVDAIIEQARHRPDLVRDQAADFGTQAHGLIEQIILGTEPEVPPDLAQVVDNFTSWRRKAGLDIHLAETMVYSAKVRRVLDLADSFIAFRAAVPLRRHHGRPGLPQGDHGGPGLEDQQQAVLGARSTGGSLRQGSGGDDRPTGEGGVGGAPGEDDSGVRGPTGLGPGRLFHRVQGSTVLVAVHAEGANVIKNRAGKKSSQIYWELAEHYSKMAPHLSTVCA